MSELFISHVESEADAQWGGCTIEQVRVRMGLNWVGPGQGRGGLKR